MFLAPLFLIAAALGASFPLILHLMQNQRKEHVPFPTLRFLKLAEKQSSKKVKMENFLLWLIRTLIMLLARAGFRHADDPPQRAGLARRVAARCGDRARCLVQHGLPHGARVGVGQEHRDGERNHRGALGQGPLLHLSGARAAGGAGRRADRQQAGRAGAAQGAPAGAGEFAPRAGGRCGAEGAPQIRSAAGARGPHHHRQPGARVAELRRARRSRSKKRPASSSRCSASPPRKTPASPRSNSTRPSSAKARM